MKDDRSSFPCAADIAQALQWRLPGTHAEMQRICAALESGAIDRASFLESCSRLVVSEIGCSRAGIWVFRHSERGRSLQCLALHDVAKGALTMVSDGEVGKHVAPYFQALDQLGYVMATDARVHYATASLYASHLEPNGIESLMAATFFVDGQPFGVFTCAQVGQKMEWGRRQLDALRRIGALTGMALGSEAASAKPSI